MRLTIFSVARLFLKEVNGIKNIPKKINFIAVANHESYIDPFLICGILVPCLNKKIHFLTMRGRPFKYISEDFIRNSFGAVPMSKNREKTVNELLDLLRKGEIVSLFPGGPRSLDGNMTRGKTGAVRLALSARVPILPIGLMDTFEIAPRERLIPKLKRAKMSIGKPIYLSKYYNKKINKKLLKELTTGIMKKIAKLAGKEYLYG